MIEFQGFPKIPRLFRDMVVTEKIDGTNACVVIQPRSVDWEGSFDLVEGADGDYLIGAQSRNRLIYPANDNAGFAAWVSQNRYALVATLGPGYHYGEWWGQGIQRGYGLTEKRFSLFNVHRWGHLDGSQVPGLHVVPTLKVWTFSSIDVCEAMHGLRLKGSQAAPGFMNPEGVVVYHTASGQLFKALLENDAEPKGSAQKDMVLAA